MCGSVVVSEYRRLYVVCVVYIHSYVSGIDKTHKMVEKAISHAFLFFHELQHWNLIFSRVIWIALAERPQNQNRPLLL